MSFERWSGRESAATSPVPLSRALRSYSVRTRGGAPQLPQGVQGRQAGRVEGREMSNERREGRMKRCPNCDRRADEKWCSACYVSTGPDPLDFDIVLMLSDPVPNPPQQQDEGEVCLTCRRGAVWGSAEARARRSATVVGRPLWTQTSSTRNVPAARATAR